MDILIPVLDDNLERICDVKFKDNLTKKGVPDYANMNCLIGLLPYPGIRFEGWFVIAYYDKKYPNRSYAEIISKEEAYEVCIRYKKPNLIQQYNLNYEREIEVL